MRTGLPDPHAFGCQDERDHESDPLVLSKEKQGGTDWDFGFFGWLGILKGTYGSKLLWLLFATQHLVKGLSNTLISQATPWLYKSYNVPAPQVQIYGAVGSVPWAMKPIIGLVSDVFPIWGYNKAPYILVTSAFGMLAALVVAFLPQNTVSVTGIVVCIILVNLMASTVDLLSEAKYAEKMQQHPKYGPDLLTFVWFGLNLGSLLAVGFSGPLVAAFGPKPLFMIAAFPCIAVFVSVFLGHLEETPLSAEDVAKIRQRFLEQREACMLCVLMLVGTSLLTFVGLRYQDPFTNCVAALIVAAVMLISFSLVLSPVVAKFNAFTILQQSLTLSIDGATFYFYTDTPEEYPEGPHFSPVFFNTVIGLVGGICSLLGIYWYNRYFSTWKYRHLLILTNVAVAFLNFLDLLMFTRTNLKLGIPDHAFLFGSSVFSNIISEWAWMPQVVILSYLCPTGMEATMYALLAGCHNLGSTVSQSVGAYLLEFLHCTPSGEVGESAQFERLWVAAAIASVLPLAVILIMFRLIPDARQGEWIIDAEGSTATSGSLLTRWKHSVDEP